jgi:hypothetical protein
MKYILFLFAFSISFSVLAQSSLDEIDLHRIHQKKIRNFIDNQMSHNVHLLSDVKPTFYKGQDTNVYKEVVKKYLIKANINKVFDIYCSTSPSVSWNGHMISFGLMLNKKSNKVLYSDEAFSGVDTGQVVYVNLRMLGGIYNLAVAFEIVDINPASKQIIFSYVEGGKSQGEQLLQFVDTNDGQTLLIHKTFFKSNSKFRDKFLYPPFHIKAINEFHKNMLRVLFGGKSELVNL